jgi:hypothetical protein
MKKLIGIVNIYKSGNKERILRFYFPKNVVEVLGKSIVINIDKMSIRRASIDDVKTLTIGKLQTTIAIDDDISNYLGHYNIFQKDEDTFKLKRCLKTA